MMDGVAMTRGLQGGLQPNILAERADGWGVAPFRALPLIWREQKGERKKRLRMPGLVACIVEWFPK